ncbi:MAG: DUF418 domain-containing protein [Bacteroidales bacterium]|nr:DUF418 domain-containing protein [Bacteroidales bacterium]
MGTNVSASKQRLVVLDALRGFALLGIALANYPEFSLYSFLSDAETSAMPTAQSDVWMHWFLMIFVDGKFYTIFSVLFGIGFSMIIANARKRGADGMRIFYRRMMVLVIIGFMHLMLLWSGDILLLYALMGLLLPLFYGLSDRTLLRFSAAMLALPILCDLIIAITGIDPSQIPYALWWQWCDRFGITEDNFATWLRDSDSYVGVLQFLVQGAFERMWEFVSSHRCFKVLGLFLIGLYIGRSGIHATLSEHRQLLRKVASWGFGLGLPMSVACAWSSVNGHPFGNVVHAVFYAFSSYPLGLGYMSILSLIYLKNSELPLWKALASPGRMSLTSYLMQSVMGIAIFYGVGMGLGCSLGLWQTSLVAVSVFVLETVVSSMWLRWFPFGPFEWVWRMLTYGRFFRLRRDD